MILKYEPCKINCNCGNYLVYITPFVSCLLLCLALIRWGASQDQIFFFAMSQFDWPITPKKLKPWKLPKREGSILKHRIQWIVHSPHKTQLEKKKKSSHNPQEKKKGRCFTSLHASHWLHGNSIPKTGCHYFWPELSTVVPRSIIPYNLFVPCLHYMRTLPYWRLVVSMTSLIVKVDNWVWCISYFWDGLHHYLSGGLGSNMRRERTCVPFVQFQIHPNWRPEHSPKSYSFAFQWSDLEYPGISNSYFTFSLFFRWKLISQNKARVILVWMQNGPKLSIAPLA